MRELEVYDGDRRQAWRDALAPGEVALFFADAATGRFSTALGRRLENHWERTCLVFPSVDAAEAYAESTVAATPAVACQLYTADASEPVAIVRAPDERRGADPARARRLMLWGATLVALGVVGVLIDWHFGWYYLLGVLIGVKLLTFGFVKLGEAYAEFRRHAQSRER